MVSKSIKSGQKGIHSLRSISDVSIGSFPKEAAGMITTEHTYSQSVFWFMAIRGVLSCACQALNLVNEDNDKCIFLGV